MVQQRKNMTEESWKGMGIQTHFKDAGKARAKLQNN